eukprot:100315-Rhodomonas_salina.1
MSIPSMQMRPSADSTRRKSDTRNDDFPGTNARAVSTAGLYRTTGGFVPPVPHAEGARLGVRRALGSVSTRELYRSIVWTRRAIRSVSTGQSVGGA